MGEKKKVAKLVYVSFLTRVIVDENATETQILEASKPKFIQKVQDDIAENLEEIVDDTESPYDPEFDDKN